VKTPKKAKKGRFTVSVVTPAYGSFRRYELDTVADWGWRIFLFKEFVQGRSETRQVHAKTRQVHANVKTKKGESLKRPQLRLIAYLEAQNWTRWRVWSCASFCSRGLFRDGPKHKRSARSIRSLKFTYSSRSLTFALILSFCSLPGRCFCHTQAQQQPKGGEIAISRCQCFYV